MILFRHYIHLIIAFFTDLYCLFRALFSQVQGQWFNNDFKKSSKKSKNLCVLGNGPSLSFVADQFEQFNNVDFCVVNNSILTDVFWKIKPKIYSFTDRDYHQLDREDIKNVRSKILEIDWPIAICIPYHYPKWFAQHCQKNANVKVYRYNTSPWIPELKIFKSLRMYLYAHGLCAPNCSNVVVSAIYSSILLGYKNIYLLGVEHSWMRDVRVNEKNEVVLIDKHYYGEKERVWVDYDGNPIKITDLCESLSSTFHSYYDLEEFSKYIGDVKIINCTKGSYIDAFQRGEICEFV